MKFYIKTLGCKVNSYESNSYENSLLSAGFIKGTEEDFDIGIVNTCSVTAVADSKDRKEIRHLRKLNKDAILVVIGCYSQVNPELIANLKDANVNIVIGASHKNELVECINEFIKNKKQIIRVDNSRLLKKYEELKVTQYSENTRAFLKIQDGCDNFCSYCLVPYTRGKSRSRSYQDCVNEAKELVANGFKEIVLTGIHTANYGADLENYSFDDFLSDFIRDVKGLKRLRISSIEESEITDKFIDLLKNNKVIVPHLHIPLQSGCDETLSRMHRKYKTSDFLDTISKIRKVIPNISITTDLIVGFPGETDEEFNQTLEFLKKVKFSMIHCFPYSSRPGTIASKDKNQIDKAIKSERVNKVLELNNLLANEYIKSYLDKTLYVLFEEYKDGYLTGHGENYFRVEALGSPDLINKICKVKIIKPLYPISSGIIIKVEEE